MSFTIIPAQNALDNHNKRVNDDVNDDLLPSISKLIEVRNEAIRRFAAFETRGQWDDVSKNLIKVIDEYVCNATNKRKEDYNG